MDNSRASISLVVRPKALEGAIMIRAASVAIAETVKPKFSIL